MKKINIDVRATELCDGQWRVKLYCGVYCGVKRKEPFMTETFNDRVAASKWIANCTVYIMLNSE